MSRRKRLFAKSQKKKPKKSHNFDWVSIAFIFLGVLAFYCVLFPAHAGEWGKNIARFLSWFSGLGRFFLPLFLASAGLSLLLRKDHEPKLIRFLLVGLVFWIAMIFLSLLGEAVWGENYGGILGFIGQKFLNRIFGIAGSWIVVFGLSGVLGVLLAGHSPSEFFKKIREFLVSDWKSWRNEKSEPRREKRQPVVKPQPELAPVGPAPKPKVQLKIMGLKKENKEENIPAPQESLEKEDVLTNMVKSKSVDAPVAKESIPYKSPSIDIFEAFEKSVPVSKAELTSRAKLLEETLANFKVAASVVEIHPGPVITRYDLQPAPGVKVSSISSRSDDLALAMKSIGIRVLAPIPGKGAVGVEIPNLHPETVGLKELLARPEFLNHKSPLAFVLGKTVSGGPSIVDLAAMPHMLIAGATGSGKSVVVHSLITSILYRMPPSKVKFTLIDPKRLELPSYSQIPHLYDPRNTPANAEVITNSKQAAKTLTRLVKVMEYRYDLFAKANVRNIESFNNKREAEGLPPEYYLVVVIDELADLMLTSPKEVEDSIQRLAQMARAVGIHLVLATQRPSVDVITGVIKANLPARIALRVASSTDSRVIVDTVGAEALLGKGDMLYLPPASPDPVRVQGAFVTEAEVEKIVEHVQQFGMPDYEDLFSSGSALEFAVEDKKEMKDLIEGLKLVLERRRVSQDLLKAHFGSSARATNILSLLEVKEFIRKPEGSNRWEINFDLIEEFLTKVGQVPEGELMK